MSWSWVFCGLSVIALLAVTIWGVFDSVSYQRELTRGCIARGGVPFETNYQLVCVARDGFR